jgi:sugar lactone lactonase YvrE
MKKPLFNLFLLVFGVVAVETGCKKSDGTTAPTIQTNGVISNVSDTVAQSEGAVTSYGGSFITALGICYSSTNPTPTIADSKTSESTGAYDFVSTLHKLTPNTVYYARAYATNGKGTGYGSVVKFTTAATANSYAGTVTTFAGNGTAGYADGTGTNAEFSNPQGVAADAQGNLYVTDPFNHVIRKITPAGVVSTIAGNGNIGYVIGPAASAEFYSPTGIAVDASGNNIYVADQGNNVILKISNGVVTKLAGSGAAGIVDGAAATAQFSNPTSVAVDASGNVYVADRNNNRIRKISTAGVVSTFCGTGTAGYLDGTSTTAEFNGPTGIAIDASNNLYIADSYNHSIRKIGTDGTASTIVGSPIQAIEINDPGAIAVDSQKNLYITDHSGRIIELNVSTNISYTLAGADNTTGYAEGVGSAAIFYGPMGITMTPTGVFVADSYNNRIRKITH